MKSYLLLPRQRGALLAQHGGRLQLLKGTSELERLLQVSDSGMVLVHSIFVKGHCALASNLILILKCLCVWSGSSAVVALWQAVYRCSAGVLQLSGSFSADSSALCFADPASIGSLVFTPCP